MDIIGYVDKKLTIDPTVGAKPNIDKIDNIKITNEKDIVEIQQDGKTKIEGIFAAGDVETGPSTIVDVIGRGHIASNGINEYLRINDVK